MHPKDSSGTDLPRTHATLWVGRHAQTKRVKINRQGQRLLSPIAPPAKRARGKRRCPRRPVSVSLEFYCTVCPIRVRARFRFSAEGEEDGEGKGRGPRSLATINSSSWGCTQRSGGIRRDCVCIEVIAIRTSVS
eukprot:gene14162-biopygen18615